MVVVVVVVVVVAVHPCVFVTLPGTFIAEPFPGRREHANV